MWCIRFHLVCAGLALMLTGCQHVQLRNQTVRQSATLSDLHYREVLNNLAMFSQNPNALPFFAVAGTGQTQVRRDLAANTSLRWSLFSVAGTATNFFFDQTSLTPSVTNSTTEQWTTGTSVYPEELYLMRCVFQKTTGLASCECDEKLNAYFAAHADRLEAMQPGWFGVGKKHQVPAHAAYVGNHDGTYVWVMADNVDALTRLTLAVLDIATIDPAAIQARLHPESGRRKAAEDHVKFLVDMHKNLQDPTSEGAKALRSQIEQELKGLYLTPPVTTDSFPTRTLAPTPLGPPRRNFLNPFLAPLGNGR